jgi:hypothetical protein
MQSSTLADLLHAAPAQNTAIVLPEPSPDLESGRPMDIEAIAGVVVELGELFNIPMPHTRAIYAACLLDQITRGVK